VLQNISTHQIGVVFLTGTQGATVVSSAALSPPLLSDTNAQVVGVGNFNSGGRPDLVWQDSVNGQIGVTFLSGSNGLTVASTMLLSQPVLSDTNAHVVAVGDFSLNRHPDLIWQDYSNGNVGVVFLGGANGVTVSGTSIIGIAPANWQIRNR